MTQESNNPDAENTTQGTSETTSESSSGTAEADQPAATSATTSESETTPENPPKRRRSGLLRWAGLAALAIVPAVVVGLIVFFVAGDGDDDGGGNAAGIVDGLIRLGPGGQASVSSYAGELPPEFSMDFPIYDGAEIIISTATASEQGTSYFIVMSTGDAASNVYDFYSDELDQAPWQVEIGQASAEFTGLQFTRPDDAAVSGLVTLHQSELDDQTAIYLYFDDLSQAVTPGGDSDAFTLGNTRPLPPGFPESIPVYAGAEESVVLDTFFQRGQGGQAFGVSFLTQDTQDDVINFYTSEFEGRGWNVTDAGILSTDFALSIEFDDGDDQSLSGSITADAFDEDPDYTRVDLLVQVSSAGN